MEENNQSDSEENFNDEQQSPYILKHVRQRRVAKFNANAHDYTVQVPPLRGPFDLGRALQHLHDLFQSKYTFI